MSNHNGDSAQEEGRNGQGMPDGNEGVFARNLVRGGGAGEDRALKYMRYSSLTLDEALPLTYFPSRRDEKRSIRLIAQDMRRRGRINMSVLLVDDWRGGLGVGGYARGQALMVDTGESGRVERAREKVIRGMTPEPKQKSVG